MPIEDYHVYNEYLTLTKLSKVSTREGTQTYVCTWHVLGVARQIIDVSIKDFRNDEITGARQLRHRVRHQKTANTLCCPGSRSHASNALIVGVCEHPSHVNIISRR